jgi:all-trans-8'-apo-beta-carotenal 15,15'-oxygenase
VNDHAPLIERAFALDPCEGAGPVDSIRGTIPPSLRGTCVFNGPGRFARAGFQYRHWLDGDGMLAALTFDDQGVRVANRFVRSVKFETEQAANRAVFRTFGTAFEGDRLKRGVGLESPVNVSVYPYAGTLLAFGEQGLPWEIDPATLETRGPFTFSGQLNEITPFSAHPKVDHRTGELFNFGVSYSPEHPALNLFRFDAAGRLVYRRRLPLPHPSSVHDFALSARYAVFYVSPYILDVRAFLERGSTLMDALTWEPERGSRLVIVSRDTGAQIASLPVGAGYCLHLINAFEEGTRLIVDIIEYERPLYGEYQVVPDLFTYVSCGRPVRLVVDPAAAEILERREMPYTLAPDFPAHDLDLTGLPYDHVWMLGIGAAGRPGRKFFDQIVRLDWTTGGTDVYQSPPRHYLGGEPMFVAQPDAKDTDAVVVCQSFDADRRESAFLIFNAYALASGPIATIALRSPIPLLFHSAFLAGRG